MKIGDKVTNKINIFDQNPGLLHGQVIEINKAYVCRNTGGYEANAYIVQWNNGLKDWYIKKYLKKEVQP